MAFTFRASSVYDSSRSSSATVSKPTGTVDGDIMFTIISSMGAESPSTIPSGWTRLAIYPTWDGVELFYKIASSEGESYVWGFPENDNLRVTCASFYGDFDVLDPIDVVSNTAYNTSNTTIRAASMNVSKSNSPLLLFTYVYKETSITLTKPSVPTTDWVEDVDSGSGNSDTWHGIFHMIWSSSGATGNMDVTASGTPSDKHAFAVALNPIISGPANLKTYNTNLKANIKTINGNPLSNIKSLNTNI